MFLSIIQNLFAVKMTYQLTLYDNVPGHYAGFSILPVNISADVSEFNIQKAVRNWGHSSIFGQKPLTAVITEAWL